MSKLPATWIAAAAVLLLVPPTLSQARTSTVAGLKTAGACTDEYKANKGALKDAKEKKKDFIAACRSLPPGTPTPIGTAAAPASPAPAPASTPTAAPTPAAPRAQPTMVPGAPAAAPSRRAEQPAAPGESACGTSGYAHLPASHTAAQFCDEGQAKSHCPGQAIVWTNTKSKIYHHAGANTYGHTKEGAYMCEADATAEGDRLSKNGH